MTGANFIYGYYSATVMSSIAENNDRVAHAGSHREVRLAKPLISKLAPTSIKTSAVLLIHKATTLPSRVDALWCGFAATEQVCFSPQSLQQIRKPEPCPHKSEPSKTIVMELLNRHLAPLSRQTSVNHSQEEFLQDSNDELK